MTPLEIFEYKNRWMQKQGNTVPVHEDFEFDGKQWCRDNLKQHEWHMICHTEVYGHTFCFETEELKKKFEEYVDSFEKR